MAGDKLSAKEAALIAQARAGLEQKPGVPPGAPATAPVAPVAKRGAPGAGVEGAAPAAAIEDVATGGAAPARSLDPAERIALLMAAARAETERRRKQHKMFYLWVPVAVISVTGLWTLLWMSQKL